MERAHRLPDLLLGGPVILLDSALVPVAEKSLYQGLIVPNMNGREETRILKTLTPDVALMRVSTSRFTCCFHQSDCCRQDLKGSVYAAMRLDF